ncbi:hypothetical protein EDB85DRAFT_2203292 [Lactarius pseudohatsudake]|nr:hypothetical protein EDB85DRAFT_2203292 [Lactarius pseudohatsudake]
MGTHSIQELGIKHQRTGGVIQQGREQDRWSRKPRPRERSSYPLGRARRRKQQRPAALRQLQTVHGRNSGKGADWIVETGAGHEYLPYQIMTFLKARKETAVPVTISSTTTPYTAPRGATFNVFHSRKYFTHEEHSLVLANSSAILPQLEQLSGRRPPPQPDWPAAARAADPGPGGGNTGAPRGTLPAVLIVLQ